MERVKPKWTGNWGQASEEEGQVGTFDFHVKKKIIIFCQKSGGDKT